MKYQCKSGIGAVLLSTLAMISGGNTVFAQSEKSQSDESVCKPASSGNPIAEGWYADPDIKVYDGVYWVYPTYSHTSDLQTFMDAFSSPDLIHWTKHSRVLEKANVPWATYAFWAPSPIYRNGKYYLYFSANSIGSDNEVGGIGVGVANNPAGPFIDPIKQPIIGKFVNGAQPIDQNVFIDDDGKAYIYFGGWGHCNVARLNDDMTSVGLLPDGSSYQEITPSGYVEGPLMFKRQGVYYLMWSEGGWTGPDYRVSYAMADSPLGPFNRKGVILSQDASIGTGSGHNTVVNVPGTDEWYIFYHRHPLDAIDGNNRVLAYDAMEFNKDGTIRPVEMSNRDNFCDSNSLGWKSLDGAWKVTDEQYTVKSSFGSNSIQNNNFANFTYDADVAVGPSGNAGVLFRVSDATSGDSYQGYNVGLDAVNGRVFIGKSSGRIWTELAASNQRVEASSMHHLRVIAKGNHIEVFYDQNESPVIVLDDSSYSAGATGLRAYASSATFDNIEVVNAKTAVFYEDVGFSGAAVLLNPGDYTKADLERAGIRDNWVSSLRMPTGWTVEVFEDDHFNGSRWVYKGDTSHFTPEANDKMSSVRIFAN